MGRLYLRVCEVFIGGVSLRCKVGDKAVLSKALAGSQGHDILQPARCWSGQLMIKGPSRWTRFGVGSSGGACADGHSAEVVCTAGERGEGGELQVKDSGQWRRSQARDVWREEGQMVVVVVVVSSSGACSCTRRLALWRRCERSREQRGKFNAHGRRDGGGRGEWDS